MLMRKVLFLLLSVLYLTGQVFAQNRTITGKVTDAKDGSPIPGATIQIKGTAKGAVTTPDGSYKLEVKDGDVLIFTFVGYEPKEVKAGTNAMLNIQLGVDSKNLDEVVVTGYSIEKKKASTIAASTVSGAKVNNIALPDVTQMLQGNAAGVAVSTNSGQPGAKTEVRIRGVGSISANTNPLYVLDGVVITSGDQSQNTYSQDVLSGINAADIENITVLKDAAATALYGSRGSNGVVVITTKTGKKGTSNINFNAKYGFQNLARKIDMMNSSELLGYQREAMRNALKTDGSRRFTDAEILQNRPDYLANINTDWNDEAFRTGKTQNYAISGSGGNEKTQFYASGEYFKQDGILIGSSFTRYSGRLNVDHKFTDKLDLSAKVSSSYTDQRNASNGATYSSPLMGVLANVPFIPSRDANGNPYNGYKPGQPGTNTWSGFKDIPEIYRPTNKGGNFVHTADRNYSRNNNTQTFFNLALGYNIMEGLRFVVKGNAELTNIREKQWVAPDSYDGRNLGGYLTNANASIGLYTTQQILTYNTTFNKDHGLNVLLGNEYSYSTRTATYATKNGFPGGKLQVPGVGANMMDILGNDDEYAFHGMFTKVDYDYKSKYFVSGSYRRDGSSRFPKDNRYGNFYSGAVAWRITEEEFAKNISWLNELKFRSSYGIMGNAEGLGNFPYAPLYSFDAMYNGEPAAIAYQPGNPRLSWEKQNLFDIGIDFSVLNKRVYGSVGFYDKRSSALLMQFPLSMTSGFSFMNANVGKMMNQGFEINIGAIPVSTKNFTWTTDLNFATLKNRVLAIGGDQQFIAAGSRQRVEVGHEFGSWFMKEWAGVDSKTGAAQWIDKDGNVTNKYDEAPRRYVGSSLPKVTGGWTNRVTYKNFDLSMLITFSWGNKAYNYNRMNLENDGLNPNQAMSKDALDRWQKPGDVTDVPKAIWGNGTNSNGISSRFLEDVSYARIRNLTIGYNLPKEMMGRMKMKSLRIYAQAENLFTLTKYKGWDPDVNTNPVSPQDISTTTLNAGVDFFRYPTSRVFTFGINVGL